MWKMYKFFDSNKTLQAFDRYVYVIEISFPFINWYNKDKIT